MEPRLSNHVTMEVAARAQGSHFSPRIAHAPPLRITERRMATVANFVHALPSICLDVELCDSSFLSSPFPS
jgi:hypothetical protein